MPSPTPIKAAQYVRMSTERQIYSTARQAEQIAAYALQNGFTVVRSYADEGKSGLQLNGRTGLQRLLADVLSDGRDFEAVLVYDVSRWGRFQDVDEGAHYEFLCRRAGVSIHYCAERFENDGSLTAAVMKSLKRVMAGEFSRDLSERVFASQCRLASMGYKMGGSATYGLRRLVIDQQGSPRMVLKPGEHKASGTDRVIFIPGPPDEVAIVRKIFRWSAYGGLCDGQIATRLNQQGIPAVTGGAWTVTIIRKLLMSEVYIGTAVYNRRSSKLGRRARPVPRDQWVRRPNAFQPLIDERTFKRAQSLRPKRRVKHRISDSELLDQLRQLLAERGVLSSNLIAARDGMAYPQTFKKRFGSLDAAYCKVGYVRRELSAAPATPRLVPDARMFGDRVAAELRAQGFAVSRHSASSALTVDRSITLAPTLVTHLSDIRNRYWVVRINRAHPVDYVFAGLMRPDGERIQTMLLLPADRFPASGEMVINDGPNRIQRYTVACIADLVSRLAVQRPFAG